MTKIDLDDLESKDQRTLADPRRISQVAIDQADARVRLALIAHIRALQAAVVRASEMTEGTVSTTTQYDRAEDDPDWQEAQRWREQVTRGPVLP